jgi:hypothetical protein
LPQQARRFPVEITVQESAMTLTRFVSLALAVASASALIACTTAPAMPMGSAPAGSMATPERMAAMDAQMKTMHEMHARMMNAKTADERQALMAEHMKAMQGGMAIMKGMSGMGSMSAMADAKGSPGEMDGRHTMMGQRMEMMQMMMDMMMQRMPSSQGPQ